MGTETISIYSSEGKGSKIEAKKDDSIDHNEITEACLESLGHDLPSSKRVTLTWGDCQNGSTFNTEFRVVSTADKAVVLGQKALDDLQGMKRGDPLWVVHAKKMTKGTILHPLLESFD